MENKAMTDYISDRISLAIEASGKSKAMIAKEIGVSAQAVSNWTTNGSIDKYNLIKLSHATGASEKWLISGEDDDATDKAMEAPSQYTVTEALIPELMDVVEYAINHQLSSYYNKLPPSAQVKLTFQLYEVIYRDRALLDIAKDMQPSTLLKMTGN